MLYELREIVEHNLQNEHFSVEELAEFVNMSRSNLHRRLRELTGQSVSQFIREYRLERALEILREEDASVSEVAFKVGFSSSSYFSRRFTEYYGYPPVEVKNKLENDQVNSASRNYTKPLLLAALAIFLLLGGVVLYSNNTESKSRVARKIKLAVIPFENRALDANNQYFADGVMEAILNKLTNVNDLELISRTTVEKYRGSSMTIPEIGNELAVSFILEGSAQKYGNEIKIWTQLVDVDSDVPIWSQDYTRKFEDVLQLQAEIAERVATELQTALSVEEKQAIKASPTENVQAYNYFLHGFYQLNQYSALSLNNAISLFEEAIKLDSGYADPYFGLADVYLTGGLEWGLFDEQIAWEKAEKLLTRAIEIDPENSKLYDALAAGYYNYEWNFTEAIRNFGKYKDLEGIDGPWSVDFFVKIGQFERAERACDDQLERDHSLSFYYYIKAEAIYFQGRREEAIRLLDEADRLFEDYLLQKSLAKLYFLYGEVEKSYEALKALKSHYPDRPPPIYWLEMVHALNRGEGYDSYVDELKRMYTNDEPGSPAWFVGLCYAALGNDKMVFEWLEKSYDRHEAEMAWLKMEPALDAYKNDPRYLDLLDKMKFP